MTRLKAIKVLRFQLTKSTLAMGAGLREAIKIAIKDMEKQERGS